MANGSLTPAQGTLNVDHHLLQCRGDWTVTTLEGLNRSHQALTKRQTIDTIDGQGIHHLDSAGAWLLIQLQQQFPHATCLLSEQHRRLVELVQSYQRPSQPRPSHAPDNYVTQLGKNVCHTWQEIAAYIAFIGEFSLSTLRWLLNPMRIAWQPIWQTVQRTGLDAMPIVGLLAFLIGIVLAYQMGGQLQTYGANIYIVNLLGVSVLREFGPLITAIIVAGRSGSAFTAAIGTMQVNQEIAALQTLGVSPLERLALGKIFGLVLALPLLVMWANFTAIVGGLIMAKFQLGIGSTVYLQQFHASVGLKQFWLGMLKTPVFAIIIASIGCFQGFRVQGGADSVGRQTTRSVVQAIFLIIVADAFFSIVMSWLHV